MHSGHGMQVEKEAGLLHAAEQGVCLVDLGRDSLWGEQSSGHKHWEGESYGGNFLCAHLTFTPGLCHLPESHLGEGFTTPTGTRPWSP